MTEKLAILWDLDGTLADSEPVHEAALELTLREYGIDAERDPATVGSSRQIAHRLLQEKYGLKVDFETYVATVDRHFMANAHLIKPYPVPIALAKRFHADGRRQALVTNSSDAQLEATKKALGLPEFIDFFVNDDGAGEPKPHPDPYRRGLEGLGVEAKDAVVYEDSPYGVQSAQANGLFVIGLLHGDGARIGADVHFREFPEADPEEIVAAVREGLMPPED